MSIEELETKCIDGRAWTSRVPGAIRDIAFMASNGCPTAIGNSKEFGWFILQCHRGYGKCIVWTEKNFDKRPM